MPKRRRCDDNDSQAAEQYTIKRCRTGPRRNLMDISDEILLRILSGLEIKDLLRSEGVSRRFRSLATDREIWKAKYYDAWIESRARRIPAVKTQEESRHRTKIAKWLEHGQKLRDGPTVDWKRQFKIRSNWAAGNAKVHEVEVANPPSPPVIAKLHKGIIFTVDRLSGLRAWSSSAGTRTLKAQLPLQREAEATCMALDTSDGLVHILLGFQDGTFSMYAFKDEGNFEPVLNHRSADGPLMAVALAMPYAMTVSKTKFLSLYDLSTHQEEDSTGEKLVPIARLQSDASFSPVSLALRRTSTRVIATVAYAFNRVHSGWCMGLQEIMMSTNGLLLDSRLASTIETPFDARYQGKDKWEMATRAASSLPMPLHPQLMSPPNSLSYEHPFLVCTLADNTIMSFMVTSNETKLEVSAGRRLWGHTSAVSGAEVNNRGKAVSISCRGDEIRVWELEPVMTTSIQTKTSTRIKAVHDLSGIATALAERGSGLGLALHEMKRELSLTRRWVGFDEEQVVILGERDQTQIMALYDFT
ncbi:hypothetical protein LTR10_013752 [Elasticomyces elasticus]|uniref:F-box domain-containing protein n=1 Tax=Exophiala sideris TaxID=1016849 RepID=A0ABR0JH19_9EURO|nr:hypothetical protein LTR10_013752 [Elasticomyces elasticus]KAK5033272.1 hypothetical protein LTS07_003573 [Exophiala sideris]KAK5042231.1 hypothetical protein LTR13_002037 [Exophiala sideris]KAK5063816.1 hypothetical protein LTR69_003581 [Exophiala sideris]KAK5185499.1 hypothetical protein LTR44_002488 [Eurotiomycetes sp. CCFEE 6388]